MTPASVGPLSRPISVLHLPEGGLDVTVEASGEERAALAKDFNLAAIHRLEGRLRLTGSGRRVHVQGVVNATISQICVVTLDPFETEIEEEVVVDFARPGRAPTERGAASHADDQPDEIVDGYIDVGALTAEFLALGLDPYPRKPGVSFSFEERDTGRDSPFAGLKKLKGEE